MRASVCVCMRGASSCLPLHGLVCAFAAAGAPACVCVPVYACACACPARLSLCIHMYPPVTTLTACPLPCRARLSLCMHMYLPTSRQSNRVPASVLGPLCVCARATAVRVLILTTACAMSMIYRAHPQRPSGRTPMGCVGGLDQLHHDLR